MSLFVEIGRWWGFWGLKAQSGIGFSAAILYQHREIGFELNFLRGASSI